MCIHSLSSPCCLSRQNRNRYCQSPVLLLSSCMPDPTPRLTSVATTIRRRSIAERTQLVRGRSVPAIPFIRIALDTRFRIIRSQRLEGGQPSYVRESKAGICLLEAETHGPICALYQILGDVRIPQTTGQIGSRTDWVCATHV
jgi:hypothetical protein